MSEIDGESIREAAPVLSAVCALPSWLARGCRARITFCSP